MVRVFALFFVLALLFYFIIVGVQRMSGKEALALTKIVGYAIICSLLALLAMGTMVVLF